MDFENLIKSLYCSIDDYGRYFFFSPQNKKNI